MKKILVPVDSYGLSEKTIYYAKDLAKHYNAEIVLLNVISNNEMMGSIPSYPAVYNNYYEAIDIKEFFELSRKLLDETASFFEKEGIKCIKKSDAGNVALVIIEIAESENVDLILIADKNDSIVKHFLLGSITDKVVHHSKIPVFIVK